MAWYKSGSVNVTNGNATVYGNGTLWVDVSILYSGDVWVGPDGRLYEIASIQSNTQLTLASAYLGATANTQSYAVMPIGLLPSALAQQVKATLSTANTALSQTVRFDANQNLTSGQKATARSNIGATAAADVGLGLLSKSVAGGVDVTLSTDEAANLFYEFTGALTANINVIVPGNVRQFFVRNFTSGAYTLTVKTQAGSGFKVLQGTRVHLECDGTNVLEPTSEGNVVTVDASGNVGIGIGTGTPAQALDVRNATGGNISAGRTTNVGANSEPGTFLVTAPNSNGNSRTWASLRTVVTSPTEGSEASALALHTQQAGALKETVRLDASGNVGVGTTAPEATLHVNGDIRNGAPGANLGMIIPWALGAVPSSSVKAIIGAANSTTGLIAGSLLFQPRTGVNATYSFYTEGTEKVRIDNAGNIFVGATPQPWYTQALQVKAAGMSESSNGGEWTYNAYRSAASTWNTIASGGAARYGQAGDHRWYIGNAPAGSAITWTQAMTLDVNGNLGVGTTSATQRITINGGLAVYGAATVGASTGAGIVSLEGSVLRNYVGDGTGWSWALTKRASSVTTDIVTVQDSGSVGIGSTAPVGKLEVRASTAPDVAFSNTATSVGGNIASLKFYSDPSNVSRWAGIVGMVPAGSSGIDYTALSFYTNNGASSNSERMRLDPAGNLLVGVISGTYNVIAKTVAEGGTVFGVQSPTTGVTSMYVCAASGTGENAAASVMNVRKNATTSRSINAAGTINASGADYAEYMTKADDCKTLAKGQIVGVDAQGQLTDKWADAVSFLVKSTDPSYVGGDVWGTEKVIGAQRPAEPVYVGPPDLEPQEPQVPADYDSENFRDAPIVPPQPADVGLLDADADPEAVQNHESAHAQYLVDMEAYVAAKAELDQYNTEHFAYQVDRTARIQAYNEAKAAYDTARAKYQAAVDFAKHTFDNVTMPAYEQDLAAFETKLEEARQKVDRIAYCGQVPVNVQGAKPGQFVVPVQDGDGIGAQLVDDDAITFAQYRRTVGIVQNVLADGRANIRVKVV